MNVTRALALPTRHEVRPVAQEAIFVDQIADDDVEETADALCHHAIWSV